MSTLSQETLDSIVKIIVRESAPDAVILFGSHARGDARPDSDVDLMVVGEVTLAELVPLIRAAERTLGREVNSSVYPVKEFTAGLKRGAHFLKRVMAGPKLFVEGSDRELERLAR